MTDLTRSAIDEHKAVKQSLGMLRAIQTKTKGIDFISYKANDRVEELIRYFEQQEQEMRKHIEKKLTT